MKIPLLMIALLAALYLEVAATAQEPDGQKEARTFSLECAGGDCVLLKGFPMTRGMRAGSVKLKPGESVGWHTTGENEEAIESDPPQAEDWEIHEAANRFRIVRRLGGEEGMQTWLEEHGLSSKAFHNIMRAQLQARKFKSRITEAQIGPFFKSHPHEFDIAQFFQVEAPTEVLAVQLATKAREKSLLAAAHEHLAAPDGWDLRGSLVCRRAYELPVVLSSAKVGTVVGPELHSAHYRVMQLL